MYRAMPDGRPARKRPVQLCRASRAKCPGCHRHLAGVQVEAGSTVARCTCGQHAYVADVGQGIWVVLALEPPEAQRYAADRRMVWLVLDELGALDRVMAAKAD